MRFQSVQSIIWLQMIWNMKHKTYGLRLWYFYDGFSFFVELDSLLLNEKELYTAGYRVCKSMMVKKWNTGRINLHHTYSIAGSAVVSGLFIRLSGMETCQMFTEVRICFHLAHRSDGISGRSGIGHPRVTPATEERPGIKLTGLHLRITGHRSQPLLTIALEARSYHAHVCG